MPTFGIILITTIIVFLLMFVLQNINSAERKLNYKIVPLAVNDPALSSVRWLIQSD